jgi:hypothetical protein
MSVFPTDKHLASWAGQCPGNHQSAGKQRSGRTRNGSKWLNETLKQAALAATRTKNSYLQALYQRLRPRIGHGRAIGAVKHSILIAIWHMLSTGETYRDLGGDYFARRDPNASPDASSHNSNASATPSPFSRPAPPLDQPGFSPLVGTPTSACRPSACASEPPRRNPARPLPSPARRRS